MNKYDALEAVQEVMDAGHDGRITQATMDYYRDIPTEDEHIVKVAKIQGEPVGAIVLRIAENKAVDNSIIVVKPSHRRQGIGQKLLKAMLAECTEKGITFACGLADDNQSAVGLMNKFPDVPMVGTEQATRRSGTFTRRWYGAMPTKAAVAAGVEIEGVDEDGTEPEVVIE